jgi:hypothetical protein
LLYFVYSFPVFFFLRRSLPLPNVLTTILNR